ncbi:hypothetical protein KFL_000860060 [Klebsormidium nitens]|uniref:Uncharacterized protein n=1 Tax=Klebsormidium nitens TaxID=105231 RepID=A0A1Y1HSM4_KLENI|nr:hypothetical protein KFL_000860060 [Klebsormidium nitens]|eukprot:GAQ81634.1 hypothetical protein KFL_000860060 [Klebsormidium nitens]
MGYQKASAHYFQLAGVTSRPDSKDTLDELALLPGVSSPSTPLRYNDVIQLIDVQRPYYALFDMAQLSNAAKPTVRGYFLKESRRHEENGDPISGSELGRHSAIMGSVACALANPVKEKHYYLAFGAKSERIQGGGQERSYELDDEQADLIHALDQSSRSGGLFKGVAECTLFRRGMAKAVITIFHWGTSGTYEVYGRFEITYAVFTSEAFLKTVPPLPHGYAAPSAFPPKGRAGDRSMTSCSPYVDPVSIVETPELHTGDTRTGELRFLDASKAAGHFPLLPALPVSVLGSNALKCVSFFEGIENYRVLNCKLKFSKLVWLGQTVRFCASRMGENAYRITFKVGEEQVGSMEVVLDV